MKRPTGLIFAVLATGLLVACRASDPAPPKAAPPVETPPPEPEPPPVVRDIAVARIGRNSTLATRLADLGLSRDEVSGVVGALNGIFDFRRSRPGDGVRLTRLEGALETLEYYASELDQWLVRREGDGFVGEKRAVEVDQRVEMVEIPIASSLYEAMLAAGEDPSLAVELADVFAWDIDFYRDVRQGDRVRVVVEKHRVNGRLVRYGPILGARYYGSLVGTRELFRYPPASGGDPAYFDEKGQSARKAFLKSPLKFVHVTSRFGGRRHPLLGYVRQHRGIDLAAPVGTPVWSVADGTVVRAVRGDRQAGNFLVLRHANGFQTLYMHLSRFAPGVHPGARVRQKQVVAYSGNTGLSTGPHLHYEVRRHGTPVNPLTLKLPRAAPLPKAELERYFAATAEVRAQLDREPLAAAEGADTSTDG